MKDGTTTAYSLPLRLVDVGIPVDILPSNQLQMLKHHYERT
jgi:hypothetical protein